jgi:hypothetical protein
MVSGSGDKFSAGEQGLGYLYQPRLALLRLLDLPENTGVLIEGEDDLDFKRNGEGTILASLKHKAEGGRLTDLATDFWKSVRIWLERYRNHGGIQSSLRFFMFTTDRISTDSFLQNFSDRRDEQVDIVEKFSSVMLSSKAEAVRKVKELFDLLEAEEKRDFLERIEIYENSPRIEDLPHIIVDQHFRTIRRQFRDSVFERLEGWWTDLVIEMLTGTRTEPIYSYEVSDKLAAIAEEYQADNLPITFRDKQPSGGVDPNADPRLFVRQLRALNIDPTRIQHAIVDYYRAFEQRSSWAREELLVAGEVEQYEDRLVDEWSRYKAVACEELKDGCEDSELITAGRAILKWAEFETSYIRIRERVTEPYIVRGGFHILANNRPLPRIFWHPKFLEQIHDVLEDAS